MANAAHGRLLDVGRGAGQEPLHGVVQLVQRGRLDAVERGDAQQHVVAQALGELLEDLAGVVELQVHQDGGDDLRVLVLDQVGDGGGVHPLQAFDAGRVAALQDARDQVGGLVVAQRLGQHGADHAFVNGERRPLGGELLQFVEHRLDLFARHGLDLRHGVAELLDLLRPEMLQYFGGLVLAQRQEQHGALFQPLIGIRHRPTP